MILYVDAHLTRACKNRCGSPSRAVWQSRPPCPSIPAGRESAQTYSSDIQPMDPQTVELLKALTKLSLKHEDELRRQRPDQDFEHGLLRCGTPWLPRDAMKVAEEWSAQCEQGKVKSALRHIMFGGFSGSSSFACMRLSPTRSRALATKP